MTATTPTGVTPTRMDETRVDLSLEQSALDSTPQSIGEPSANSTPESKDAGEGTSRQVIANIEIDQIEAGPSSECNVPAIMVTDAGQNGIYDFYVRVVGAIKDLCLYVIQ